MRHLPINWENGMKVNKDHFQGMENAHRYELLDHLAHQVNDFNFGLLPYASGSTSLDVFVKLDQTSQVVVSLNLCQAITSNGVRIDILPEDSFVEPMVIPLERISEALKTSEYVNLYLVADVFRRIPAGNPDPQENPVRQPFTRPMFKFSLESGGRQATALERGPRLLIGRILGKNGNPALDEEYIPPCTSFLSMPRLRQVFKQWEDALNALYNNGLFTVEKVGKAIAEGKDSIEFQAGQKVSVANATRIFSTDMVRALSDLIPLFRQLLVRQPPLYTEIAIQQFSYRLKTTLSQLLPAERSQFENYLSEAAGVKGFSDTLDDVLKHQYEHTAISESIQLINRLLGLLLKAYNRESGLPGLDFTWRKVETKGVIDIEEKWDDLNTLAK